MAGTSDVRILSTGLDPIKLLSIKSPEDYELIIQEWLDSYLRIISKQYTNVERLAGAGDKGRDVVCTVDKEKDIWDNYQCKHYASALMPSQIWVELGKIVYYCFKGDYSCPRKCYFVAPQGVGTTLRDLLKNPDHLKQGLIDNWARYCKEGITSKEKVVLENNFKEYADNFDYSIFDYIEPSDFLEQLRQTPYYTKHFGVLSKPRPLSVCPEEVAQAELAYISKILDAYSEHLNTNIAHYNELTNHPELFEHFKRQRRNFYEAQTLKEFSRDIHDPKLAYFEQFVEDIYDGIIDEIDSDAKNGFERLKNVLKRAEQIQLTSNPLHSEVRVKDRHGICHHIANERDDIKWVK
jgi:hypothetical protein